MQRKKRVRNRIIVAIIIGLLVTLFILFFCHTAYFLFPSHDDRAGELVKLLFTVIGGVCLLYGLYISNRRAKATEKSVMIQGSQIELTLKSQIDERFKNAIEHLGSDNEPIILGGVAELHQIAKENSSKYAEVVFNIFKYNVWSLHDGLSFNQEQIFHHLLSTQQYTSQICDNLGARINQITISDFNSFTFGFPKQARETNKIAQFIDLLDDRIATQSQIIKELKTLMKELSRVIFAKNRIGAKPSFFSELYIT